MPFTKGESARQVSNARWQKSAEERTEKRIDELVRMAPALTPTMRAKLQALLAGQSGGAA